MVNAFDRSRAANRRVRAIFRHPLDNKMDEDELLHELVDSDKLIIKRALLSITERDRRNNTIAGSGYYWRSAEV